MSLLPDSGLDASPPASTHELTIPNDVSRARNGSKDTAFYGSFSSSIFVVLCNVLRRFYKLNGSFNDICIHYGWNIELILSLGIRN